MITHDFQERMKRQFNVQHCCDRSRLFHYPYQQNVSEWNHSSLLPMNSLALTTLSTPDNLLAVSQYIMEPVWSPSRSCWAGRELLVWGNVWRMLAGYLDFAQERLLTVDRHITLTHTEMGDVRTEGPWVHICWVLSPWGPLCNCSVTK